MTEPNNILHFLKKSTDFLEKKGIPNPRVDAEWLLSDLLNLTRIKLYAQFETPLSDLETKQYRERIVERGKRKPVAYITGKKGFHKFDFLVNEHTLIPRPETEELVDYVYKNFKPIFKNQMDSNEDQVSNPTEDLNPYQIWDLCSGSGCIGLSLGKLLKDTNILLSDISDGAIEVSKQNAERLGLTETCQFFVSDLDGQIPNDFQFDLVVSNPPYIPIEEKSSIMPDVVDFEPHSALFVGNFISFHEHLIQATKRRLKPGGKVLIETHPLHIHELEKIVLDLGFTDTKRLLDSSNKERFLLFSKPINS